MPMAIVPVVVAIEPFDDSSVVAVTVSDPGELRLPPVGFLTLQDPETGEMVFYKDLEANQFVIPGSGYHMRMSPEVRLKHTFDDGICSFSPTKS